MPNYPTWGLEMRNVYHIGADLVSREGFDVKVMYTKTGKDILVQPIGEIKTFNYLLGLDRLNELGEPVDGGDGIIDKYNLHIFNYSDGYILFPSLRPFDPNYYTQFKIDNSLAVEIYDTRNQTLMVDQHKFDIEISILDTVVVDINK